MERPEFQLASSPAVMADQATIISLSTQDAMMTFIK